METVGAEMKSNDSAEWGAKTAKFGCDVGLATSDPHTMKAQFEGESAEDVQYPSPKSVESDGKCSRVFVGSLKTSKFWTRILRPWKWRKKTRKNNLRRTNSDRSPESNVAIVTMPTSLSSIEPIHMAELVDGEFIVFTRFAAIVGFHSDLCMDTHNHRFLMSVQ
uniref:Ovate family protein n=1 Tax=Ascaris lumbricoides TaxID=6252 RepID=A0A0M3IUY5_ASCLU